MNAGNTVRRTDPVRRLAPQFVRFRGTDGQFYAPTAMVRRTARLNANSAIAGLGDLLERVQPKPEGWVVVPFVLALQKYTMSYHAHSQAEQMVDLATALEAALSGQRSTEVLLRLRSRAAALLQTERDPAGVIFDDIGHLYELRSRLVHGGRTSSKDYEKLLRKLSVIEPSIPVGVAGAYAVDRFRDIVRRALLSRIGLAQGTEPLWSLMEDRTVDRSLADDATRREWRSSWRAQLHQIGAGDAADPAASPVDALVLPSRENAARPVSGGTARVHQP
jgi:hypothetical protein